jgi:hypothetical protein
VRDYNIHDRMRLRTNIPFTTIPSYFLSDGGAPNIELLRVDQVELPSKDKIASEVGYTIYDLGGGDIVYDTDIPIMYLLGSKARWRMRLSGLADERTQILTSVPFFDWRPVGFKVTELLSRLYHLILVLKLVNRGFAMCHATTVARDGEAFLLFGYSGTGKSTLASLMLRQGYEYMSEDFTLVDRDGVVYCYPDMPPPRSRLPRVPLMRYVRATFADRSTTYDICRQAEGDSILVLEKGPDRSEEMGVEETIRRITLLNLEELSKLWNSPISVLLNHYAYFYPRLDLPGLVDRYNAIVASFISKTHRRERIQSSSASFGKIGRSILGPRPARPG